MRLLQSFHLAPLAITAFLLSGCHPTQSHSLTTTTATPAIASKPDLNTLEMAAKLGDAKDLARYGSALVESGQVRDGIAFLRRALRRDPKLIPAWHNLALAAESQGWLDVAADSYAKVVAAKPELAGEWVKYGYSLIALGRYGEAETAFNKASSLKPDSPEAQVALASLYYADFRFDKALEALTRATTINPKSAAAFVNIAAIQVERHKEAEAEVAIRKAIAIDPEAPRYHLILGGILARSPDSTKRSQALTELEKAQSTKATPTQQAEALYHLATLARQNGDKTGAIAKFRQSMALDPSRSDAYLAVGRLLVTKGGTDATEGHTLLNTFEILQKRRDEEQKLRQKVEQQPNDGLVRLQLGKLLLTEGNLPRAVWELREAKRLNPKSEDARTALNQALKAQGRSEKEEAY